MAAQGLSVFPVAPASSTANQSCRKPSEQILHFNLSSSFLGTKLRFQPSSFGLSASKRCRSTMVIVSSLPTKRTAAAADKNPKWSARAMKAFSMAELESRKLKHLKIGTEALLLGILVEGTSLASRFLRQNGITLFNARDEIVKLLGKSDPFVRVPRDPPLTEPAQRALDWAIEEKLKSGESGEVTVSHMLLGIWSEKESAGHKVLAALGFDDDKAKELAKIMDKDVILSFK